MEMRNLAKLHASKIHAKLELDQPWDLAFCHHFKLRVVDYLQDVDHVSMNAKKVSGPSLFRTNHCFKGNWKFHICISLVFH